MRFMLLMMPGGYIDAARRALPDAAAAAALDGGARHLRRRKAAITDGPFTEAKAVVGGCRMIQVRSWEEALEWATRCPAGEHDTIEVRQVQKCSDFPADVQAAAGSLAPSSARLDEPPPA